jgi:RHS repeat-associated protein
LNVGGSSYSYTTGYNAQNGRIAAIGYPSGFGIDYTYTSLGYLSGINDATSHQNYWTMSQRDAELHPVLQSFGNGVAETNTYNAQTGLLTNVRAGSSNAIAQFDYQYDLLGNLTYRSDDYQGIFEDYCFDALNRLTSSATGTSGTGVSGCSMASGTNIASKTLAYDALGDITMKSDVGTYSYPAAGQMRPHAVSSISGTVNGASNPTFAYDNNGNMLSGANRGVTYWSFNMANQITQGTTTIAFTYDTEHARITQVGPAGTTTYLNDPASGAMAEQVVNGSTTNWHDYVIVPASENGAGTFLAEHVGGGSAGTPANWNSVNWGNFTWSGSVSNMLYFTSDHLGSIAVASDPTANPATAERDSYDAWGKRRNVIGTDNPACSVTSEATRGFTHQEMMDSVCLINFNARVYDPTLGRFMAPDPVTMTPYDPQSLSRYTYVGNNPTDKVDPTGMVCTSSSSNGNDVTTCTPNNFDSSKAKDQTIGAPDRAVNALVANKSQFSLSSDQEARDTGEKLSSVNHTGDGSETIQSLSPTGKNGIGTTTSTGIGDLSHADMVAHGHVNDSDHSVAPGPRDNSPLVNNHLANGIVKGNTVGVLTMNKGEYTFTVVTGRLQPANGLSMPSDVQLIQKALDNFQNQYQQQ